MQNEGLAGGAIQSVIQESIFRGSSQAAYKAIDFVNNKLGTNKRKAGNAVATIAAETLGTVLALGFARGRVKAESDEGTDAPDRVGDILKSFTDQVWKSVEQAQLAMQDPEFDVVDTEYNTSFDFGMENLSQLEMDVITGMVVLDEEGNNLSSELSSYDADTSALASSI
jgi:hypothetical protein